MPSNLLGNVDIIRHSNAVAAGKTVVTPAAGIDMAGAENLLFVAQFGAITAGADCYIEARGSDDDGDSDPYTPLDGTRLAVADTDDNKVVLLQINRPVHRYIKLIIHRDTQNVVVDSVLAIRSGMRTYPVAADATVADTEEHSSPVEGSA